MEVNQTISVNIYLENMVVALEVVTSKISTIDDKSVGIDFKNDTILWFPKDQLIEGSETDWVAFVELVPRKLHC